MRANFREFLTGEVRRISLLLGTWVNKTYKAGWQWQLWEQTYKQTLDTVGDDADEPTTH
jgi:hypothetical protein